MEQQCNPNFSVDCVIFGYDLETLNVLLVERELKNEQGNTLHIDHTLTGNHIYDNEELDVAAARILHELTGLYNIYLEQFRVFSHPDRLNAPIDQEWLNYVNRNPKNRVISIGYYSLINVHDVKLQLNERQVDWHPVSEIKSLGFDHFQILQEALVALREKLRTQPICFELLPKKFTLTQLQHIYEVIMGVRFDKRNFRKKISRMKYLEPLNEKQTGVAHKPAQLYKFDKKAYDKNKQQVFDFSV